MPRSDEEPEFAQDRKLHAIDDKIDEVIHLVFSIYKRSLSSLASG